MFGEKWKYLQWLLFPSVNDFADDFWSINHGQRTINKNKIITQPQIRYTKLVLEEIDWENLNEILSKKTPKIKHYLPLSFVLKAKGNLSSSKRIRELGES